MTLNELYKALRESLSESDARYVITKRLSLTQADIIANPDQDINPKDALKDLELHKAGAPLSRIYGEREFWGLKFELSEGTLDPRQDTETLIEAVLKRYANKPPKRILDLGTGAGCILISLLAEFPEAIGMGIDQSADAVETAKKNAKQNQVEGRATFQTGNWLEELKESEVESFDLVVSNPPYIEESVIQNLDESVKNHDPIQALDGGEDGLQAYKDIFSQLFLVLKPGGKVFFEIGFDQSESVMRLSRESRFLVEATYPDLAGHIRVVEVTSEKSSGDK